MRLNRNWCKLKHAQVCRYYEQVTWLPLNSAIKLFQELHVHTMYKDNMQQLELIFGSRFHSGTLHMFTNKCFVPDGKLIPQKGIGKPLSVSNQDDPQLFTGPCLIPIRLNDLVYNHSLFQPSVYTHIYGLCSPLPTSLASMKRSKPTFSTQWQGGWASFSN
jgi:hypothetical protein